MVRKNKNRASDFVTIAMDYECPPLSYHISCPQNIKILININIFEPRLA